MVPHRNEACSQGPRSASETTIIGTASRSATGFNSGSALDNRFGLGYLFTDERRISDA